MVEQHPPIGPNSLQQAIPRRINPDGAVTSEYPGGIPRSLRRSSASLSVRNPEDTLGVWAAQDSENGLPSLRSISALHAHTLNSQIVDKKSAVLGYPAELSTGLNTDHRGVCKFSAVDDPNYEQVRNVIRMLVREAELHGT